MNDPKPIHKENFPPLYLSLTSICCKASGSRVFTVPLLCSSGSRLTYSSLTFLCLLFFLPDVFPLDSFYQKLSNFVDITFLVQYVSTVEFPQF